MELEYTVEYLGPELAACVSKEHRFGTDAFLLAYFSRARHKDLAVDLGTGCGIIPLLLYKMYRPAKVYGVELQQQGAALFEKAISLSHLEDRLFPICADLRQLWGILPADRFDLITCNPTYQRADSGFLSREPAKKLARHELGCTIEEVCQAACRLLKTGGRLCLCQRPERLAYVICAMRQSHIEPKRLRLVAKNSESVPWLFLIEGKKGAAPGMTAGPTLQINGTDGFSRELMDIYRLTDTEE